MKNKKGQLSLAEAPTVVLLVGLTFLIMATIAFIGAKYGDSMGSTVAVTVVNETFNPTTTGTAVQNASACNFASFSVAQVVNATNFLLNTGNYTVVESNGTIANRTGSQVYGNTGWKATYSYTWGGVACEVTDDLNTEIANNTSIAGIVLTISLVGIVLTVLIGIFLVARAPGRA